jgi:hypothetical protein
LEIGNWKPEIGKTSAGGRQGVYMKFLSNFYSCSLRCRDSEFYLCNAKKPEPCIKRPISAFRWLAKAVSSQLLRFCFFFLDADGSASAVTLLDYASPHLQTNPFLTMKTRNLSCPSFLFFLFLMLAACHLERKEPIADTCTTNLPVASFDVDVTDCDKPCAVVVTNTSSDNSISYQWFFGENPIPVTSKDPSAQVLDEVGQIEIMLVVQNSEGCSDTASRFVTVNELNVKFKATLSTGALNAIPYVVAELSNGDFHVAYEQSGLKSAFVNRTGNATGTGGISLNMTINQMTPYNGGFVVSGEKSPKAKIALVDNARNVDMQPEFGFPGATASLAAASMVNQNEEIVVTGFKSNSGTIVPGFARYSQSGVVLANTDINFTGTPGYGAASVVQRPSGEYLLAANCLSGSCAAPCAVLSVSANGGYNDKFNLPLTEVLKIVQLTGDTYVAIGYSGSTPKAVGFNGGGTILWPSITLLCTEVADVATAADGNFVVCGTEGNSLYYAKMSASGSTVPIWEKPVSVSGSTLNGTAIIQTSDGGYAVLGKITTAGVIKIYLVKTDAQGEYQ